jgi:FAD/FMN-containing dehydrogenase
MLSDRLGASHVSRNQLLSDPVALYQNRSADSTDILHEYFIPPDRFADFLQQMREIMPRYDADLMNLTVRHVLADDDAFLRYADREMFSLVLLFNQKRTDQAESQMQALTRALVDAALAVGGRHYLPYRLHATPEQFDRAYPQGSEFFDLKRKHDPGELFQNQFYLKYAGAK